MSPENGNDRPLDDAEGADTPLENSKGGKRRSRRKEYRFIDNLNTETNDIRSRQWGEADLVDAALNINKIVRILDDKTCTRLSVYQVAGYNGRDAARRLGLRSDTAIRGAIEKAKKAIRKLSRNLAIAEASLRQPPTNQELN